MGRSQVGSVARLLKDGGGQLRYHLSSLPGRWACYEILFWGFDLEQEIGRILLCLKYRIVTVFNAGNILSKLVVIALDYADSKDYVTFIVSLWRNFK